MTPTTFGSAYAATYDAIYAQKDYDRECDLVEAAFAEHSSATISSVFDLGCGTGNHAIRLAARGYRVTGVDRSAEMLVRAVAKARGTDRTCWIHGDVRSVDAGGPYDAALLMFAVLGYQHTNDDVSATFANIRRHVRDGGLLIFDTWYGPGVLSDPPRSRSRIIETPDGPVEREVTSHLDTRRHICDVRYRLRCPGGALLAEETHVVRYFFPMELEMYLETHDFRLLQMGTSEDPNRAPDQSSWNATIVAQAV